jgi:hypothetical protein
MDSSGRVQPTISVWQMFKPIRGAMAAGAVAGLISAGIGGRLVMHIIALANPDRDGAITDSSATVGQITGDTAAVLILGTILGVLGGAVYLGVRRWLPVPAAWHGVAYGIVSLLTVGNVLFDANNVDFQIFEPVVLVVALFAVLFLVNGLIVAALADRFRREPEYRPSLRVSRAVAGVIATVCLFGALLMSLSVVQMIDDEGTCVSAAEGGGCAVRATD